MSKETTVTEETPAVTPPQSTEFMRVPTPEQNAALLGDIEIVSYLAAWVSRNILATRGPNYHYLAARFLQQAKIDHGPEFATKAAYLVAANSEYPNARVRLSGALRQLGIKNMELPAAE